MTSEACRTRVTTYNTEDFQSYLERDQHIHYKLGDLPQGTVYMYVASVMLILQSGFDLWDPNFLQIVHFIV